MGADDLIGLIRFHRQQRGWTIAQLAGKCHLSEGAVGAYERGTRQPAVGDLVDILDVLGFEVRAVPKPAPGQEGARMAAQLRYIADRIEKAND